MPKRIPAVANQQPVGNQRLNEKHWLHKDLLFVHSGTLAFINGRPVTESIGANIATRSRSSRFNQCLRNPQGFLGNNSAYEEYAIEYDISRGATCAAWNWQTSGGLGNNAIISLANTGARAGVSLGRGGNYTSVPYFSSANTDAVGTVAAPTANLNRSEFLVGTYVGTNNRRIYVDGAHIATDTANVPAGGVNVVMIHAGRGNGGAIGSLSGNDGSGTATALPLVIARALNADEIDRLYREQLENPWQLFSSRRVWIPVTNAQPTTSVVNQTLATTSGTFTDFTTAGFGAPDAAIVLFSDANTTNNPQNGSGIGIGLWDGTNQRVMSVWAQDNAANTVTRKLSKDTAIAALVASTTTWSCGYTISRVPDGVRLTMAVDNTADARYATVIMFKGVKAKVITLTPNSTVDGTATSADLGFTPKMLVASCIGFTGSTPNSGSGQTSNINLSVGAATADGTQRSSIWHSLGSSANTQTSAYFAENIIAGEISVSSLTYGIEITGWGSSDFTATTRTGGSGGDIVYALAMGGDSVAASLGTITTATATGAVTTTTTGVDPTALLLSMTSVDTAGVLKTDAQSTSFSLGAASSTVNAGYAALDEDAAGLSQAEAFYSGSNALTIRGSTAGTSSTLVSASATLDVEQFVLDYNTISATARKGWYLAVGPAAAAADPSGDLAGTEANDTFYASGSVILSGDLDSTETGIDTFAATGTAGSTITGSLAATETGTDAFTAAGDVFVQGSLTATETGVDVFAASGDVLITGSLSSTETGTDTFASTADVVVSGALSVSEVQDTFTASGDVFVKGSLSATETGTDTFTASGDVFVTGSFTGTEAQDSFAGTGDVFVVGSLSATETGTDTFAAAGDIFVQGSFNRTETGTDTFTSSGDVFVRGSLSSTETGVDVFTAAGDVFIVGSLSATEASDTFTATSGSVIQGSFNRTETGTDTFTAAGDVFIQGSFNRTEAQDSFVATGDVFIEGSLSATETGTDTFFATSGSVVQGSLTVTETGTDTFTSSGDVVVRGSFASTEVQDSFVATGDVFVQGSFNRTEAQDSFVASGDIFVRGSFASTETGVDVFAASTDVIVKGSFNRTETGTDTFTASGDVVVRGSFSGTEAQDTFFATSSQQVSGNFFGSELADQLAANGSVLITTTVAITETGIDVFESTANVYSSKPTLILSGPSTGFKYGANQEVSIMMRSETDHLTGFVGATLSISISKNGSVFNSIARTVTEIGFGVYYVSLTADDVSTLGPLVILATAAGADNTVIMNSVALEPLSTIEFLALQ